MKTMSTLTRKLISGSIFRPSKEKKSHRAPPPEDPPPKKKKEKKERKEVRSERNVIVIIVVVDMVVTILPIRNARRDEGRAMSLGKREGSGKRKRKKAAVRKVSKTKKSSIGFHKSI